MLRVNQIKVPIWVTEDKIKEYLIKGICHKLKINSDQIIDYDIFKRSIDSRKNELLYVYSLNVRLQNEKKYRINSNDVSLFNELKYKFPYQNNTLNTKRIVIIGLGPAGLYCAYMLAKAGFKPIVFERGKSIEQRTEDVRKFWETGVLETSSNVQFGEGGAGAFSDGKLNTLVKDKNGRNREVLKVFVEHGAPKEILYDNKPHIGTDLLVDVVKNIRNNILSLGGEINYNSYVSDFVVEGGKLVGIIVNQKEIPCDALCLAIGHSARDTFRILYSKGIPMSAKNFAVGFRVMHPQKLIDENQYGTENLKYNLPASSYKLTYQSNSGRGVYSFCMCPGGYVVNASSVYEHTAVNGMSYNSRDSHIANSAIIVSVTSQDYGSEDALAGVEFQEKLEKKTYALAKGVIPIEKYGSFKEKFGIKSDKYSLDFEPAIKGQYKEADLTNIFSKDINLSFIEGMEDFGRKIKDFNDGNVILAGIESRTSSAVRIWRDNETGMSEINGLFPCGEGAGYAGGITSAAMDGIISAEHIAKYINNLE